MHPGKKHMQAEVTMHNGTCTWRCNHPRVRVIESIDSEPGMRAGYRVTLNPEFSLATDEFIHCFDHVDSDPTVYYRITFDAGVRLVQDDETRSLGHDYSGRTYISDVTESGFVFRFLSPKCDWVQLLQFCFYPASKNGAPTAPPDDCPPPFTTDTTEEEPWTPQPQPFVTLAPGTLRSHWPQESVFC
jgi:hypothetical protein